MQWGDTSQVNLIDSHVLGGDRGELRCSGEVLDEVLLILRVRVKEDDCVW